MRENVPLREFTTLRVGGPARYFFVARMHDDIHRAALFAEEKNLPLFVLGGGSNILFSDDGFPGVVIKNEVKGIVYDRDDKGIVVHANGGVEWDDLVADVVSRGLWGLENLSGIPGTVGAAPIQNIGAYGTEAKDTILFVDVYDFERKRAQRLTNEECTFGYRNSMFKKDKAKRFFVRNIAFRLSEKYSPNISYKDITEHFSLHQPKRPGEVRKAVLAIRREKIPDPKDVPNVGSFFKNPVVSIAEKDALLERFPDLAWYPLTEGQVKLGVAWLIDHVGGWKGRRTGNVGVHERHALVLVNYARGSAGEIHNLAENICADIKEKTGIVLTREVESVGNFS